MPVYLYKCKKCGKEFEYQQRITDEALTHCPAEICEEADKGTGEVIRKISSHVGLVFHGKGFYLTDYVHKNNNYNGNGTSSDKNHTETKTTATVETNGKATETKPAEVKP